MPTHRARFQELTPNEGAIAGGLLTALQGSPDARAAGQRAGARIGLTNSRTAGQNIDNRLAAEELLARLGLDINTPEGRRIRIAKGAGDFESGNTKANDRNILNRSMDNLRNIPVDVEGATSNVADLSGAGLTGQGIAALIRSGSLVGKDLAGRNLLTQKKLTEVQNTGTQTEKTRTQEKITRLKALQGDESIAGASEKTSAMIANMALGNQRDSKTDLNKANKALAVQSLKRLQLEDADDQLVRDQSGGFGLKALKDIGTVSKRNAEIKKLQAELADIIVGKIKNITRNQAMVVVAGILGPFLKEAEGDLTEAGPLTEKALKFLDEQSAGLIYSQTKQYLQNPNAFNAIPDGGASGDPQALAPAPAVGGSSAEVAPTAQPGQNLFEAVLGGLKGRPTPSSEPAVPVGTGPTGEFQSPLAPEPVGGPTPGIPTPLIDSQAQIVPESLAQAAVPPAAPPVDTTPIQGAVNPSQDRAQPLPPEQEANLNAHGAFDLIQFKFKLSDKLRRVKDPAVIAQIENIMKRISEIIKIKNSNGN